jgi:hypothetical protein
MNEREEKYYEKFKSNEISNEDIRKGEVKAKKLGSEKENDFLLLIEMIKASISGEYPLPAWAIAAIIGAIIYVVSPIDAVPDIIPVAGWLDDGAVVTAGLKGLKEIIKAYIKYKKERNQ